jgi:hypothetical protein
VILQKKSDGPICTSRREPEILHIFFQFPVPGLWLSPRQIQQLALFVVPAGTLRRANWHSSATLTEVFPCFFLSCKGKCQGKTLKDGARPALLPNFCVVPCIVCFVSFFVLFVCKCALNYCHWVATQLQLTNISYHIITCVMPECHGWASHLFPDQIPRLKSRLLDRLSCFFVGFLQYEVKQDYFLQWCDSRFLPRAFKYTIQQVEQTDDCVSRS